MEKIITLTIAIFGSLALIGGWIFSLGVLWQRNKDLTERMKVVEGKLKEVEESNTAHLLNTLIHRDPDRDLREIELLRKEVHSIREDIKNLPDRFLTLLQSLNPKVIK